MRENFKIEKELLFKNNIKDITTISLDVDYKFEDNAVVGNFIVSGDYRIHEVSINREKFNFKIPFKHNITNDIDNDTLKVEITDFLYDYKKDDLMVSIEYEIIGDRKDILIFENEETLDEFLNKREVEVIDTRIDEIKDNLKKESVSIVDEEHKEETNVIILPSKKEEVKFEELNVKKECIEEKENIVIVSDEELEKEDDIRNNDNKEDLLEDKIYTINNEEREKIETEEIINNVTNIQDKFVTYKIYKVEENDTLEGIVLKYHSSVDELKEYNELNNISVGDKIIIPINE